MEHGKLTTLFNWPPDYLHFGTGPHNDGLVECHRHGPGHVAETGIVRVPPAEDIQQRGILGILRLPEERAQSLRRGG